MITIQNYDSRRALSNYQIGTIYTFNIHTPNLKRLTKVKENDFKPYIKSLTNIINKNIVENNAQYLNFTRSIGVIVDTHKSTHINDIDYITVLFKTVSNDYVINKYVVNYKQTLI